MVNTKRPLSQEERRRLTRRVFVPIERDGLFVTHDRTVYRRIPNRFIDVEGERIQFGGTIERAIPKVRGKAARRADKRARRAARATAC